MNETKVQKQFYYDCKFKIRSLNEMIMSVSSRKIVKNWVLLIVKYCTTVKNQLNTTSVTQQIHVHKFDGGYRINNT